MCFNICINVLLTRKEEFTNKNDKPKQKVLKITSNAGKKKKIT